jgi:hypothetical protein
MTWFCQGHFGFGEIMHALEASQQSELTPEEILGMRVDHGWGQIWQELGLKGKPAKEADAPLDPTALPPTAEPPATEEPSVPGNGRPENPGKSDQDKGKPENPGNSGQDQGPGKPDNPGNGNQNDKSKPDNPGQSKDKNKGNPNKP